MASSCNSGIRLVGRLSPEGRVSKCPAVADGNAWPGGGGYLGEITVDGRVRRTIGQGGRMAARERGGTEG